ncbi:MAG: hypothetical protein AB7F64_09530, partial [Gammaproteobacteria bacterium]
ILDDLAAQEPIDLDDAAKQALAIRLFNIAQQFDNFLSDGHPEYTDRVTDLTKIIRAYAAANNLIEPNDFEPTDRKDLAYQFFRIKPPTPAQTAGTSATAQENMLNTLRVGSISRSTSQANLTGAAAIPRSASQSSLKSAGSTQSTADSQIPRSVSLPTLTGHNFGGRDKSVFQVSLIKQIFIPAGYKVVEAPTKKTVTVTDTKETVAGQVKTEAKFSKDEIEVKYPTREFYEKLAEYALRSPRSPNSKPCIFVETLNDQSLEWLYEICKDKKIVLKVENNLELQRKLVVLQERESVELDIGMESDDTMSLPDSDLDSRSESSDLSSGYKSEP